MTQPSWGGGSHVQPPGPNVPGPPEDHGRHGAYGASHYFGDGGSAVVPSRVDAQFKIGLVLTVLGCLLGAALLLKSFILDVPEHHRALVFESMGRATVLAYLPVALYLFVPYVVDRYDPEPWWALAGVFLWGALFATGVSAIINTEGMVLVGSVLGDSKAGEFYSLAISAPVFEELFKGLAVFGMLVFLRREFDGVVDGIIYGTFVAIGFAATENIIYYHRADIAETINQRHGALGQIFILRGVLTPWLHPLFTSMTGIGFGLARVSNEEWKKVVYPASGYFVAVLLHAWWNGLPTLTASLAGPKQGAVVQIANLVVGIGMALAFFVIVCVLVRQKGRTIRKHLEEEMLIGTITHEELELIASWGGQLRARFSWRGRAGVEFVAAGARLALSKSHLARAMQGRKQTISADFIGPLRQKLKRLRQQMHARR